MRQVAGQTSLDRAVEGDERHHVEGADARMDAGVLAHGAPLRHGAGEGPHGDRGVGLARTGEREHAAVVVGVAVDVEERRSARRGQGVDHGVVAALRHVRHALQHVVSMGPV